MANILLNNSSKYVKVVRFLVSGGSAAAVEAAAFVVLRHYNVKLVVANTLSFLCGLMVSFSLNKLWVFSSKGNTSRQFTMYFALALVNLLLSNLIIVALTSVLNLPTIAAKLLTMATIAVWNYAFFSRIIFKERHLDV